ncbi:sulfatase [Planctomycetota bacterium]|nr:sulfatase [Planctomycetota bacterium]
MSISQNGMFKRANQSLAGVCACSMVVGSQFALSSSAAHAADSNKPLNILLFTADDLGYEAITQKPDLAPNLNKFAQQAMSFARAHMNMPISQPSRSMLATGRYGHTSGMMGFFHLKRDIPTVMQTFQSNGYKAGILGKVNHSTPPEDFEWDFVHDYAELGAGRDPEKYYKYSVEFIKDCKDSNKPFYFMVNSHDPHRPFHDPSKPMRNAAAPSKLYGPNEVVVPKFLPDLPGVRLEMSHYYNSVRRLDDTFGRVMDALEESGQADHTLVVFVSDNGSAFPFAKANAYVPSTKTNCFVRWPGIAKAGSINEIDFVSSIDMFPTFLDATGIENPGGMDGKSIVPLLKGKKGVAGREEVFTQIDYKIGGPASPMRSIENARFRYIFNPWAGADYTYRNNNEGMTMKAMDEAASGNAAIAERVRVYRHRDLQEFFDVRVDPDCTKNLIDDSAMQGEIVKMQTRLEEWMVETGDPLLNAYVARDNEESMDKALEADYPSKESMMTEAQVKKMKERQAKRNKNRKGRNKK